MIKNENYIAIQGWMVNELKLKGTALMIYAIIYGFSQAEGQVFNGSLQYLADWTNSTKQSVLNNLKLLLEENLIGKNEKIINGVKFVEYYTKNLNGVLKKFEWGIKKSLMNNIDNNIVNNIDNNSKLLLDKSEYGNVEINEMFDKWEEYFGYKPKSSKQNRFAVYNMLRAKDKGKEWLVKTMIILREAQKDKYAGNAVLGIADFTDLQRNHNKVWKWGSGKVMRNNSNDGIIKV